MSTGLSSSTAAGTSARGFWQAGSATRRAVFGFIAGAVVVLTIFQATLYIFYAIGALDSPPPDLSPTRPFGVPVLFSSAFFGGLWGILFALIEPRLPRGAGFWIAALAFGIVPLNLVLWFVVAPLKGYSLGFGFAPKDVVINIFLQASWGFGMALAYALQSIFRRSGHRFGAENAVKAKI